jgi:hypothetical protein
MLPEFYTRSADAIADQQQLVESAFRLVDRTQSISQIKLDWADELKRLTTTK